MKKYTKKEKEILLSAKNLFSTIGYKGTSMKIIADSCGISKGTMYHYYKSKEDLLLNIMEYFNQQLEDFLLDIEDQPSLTPKEKLSKELKVIVNHVIENQEFYRLPDQEFRQFENKEIHQRFQSKLIDIYLWVEKSLVQTYGESVEPYVTDGAILLIGITRNYLELIMISKQPLDVDYVIPFCIEQVEYFLKKQANLRKEALLTKQFWTYCIDVERQVLDDPLEIIKELKNLIEIKDVSSKEFIESLCVIENELIKKYPNHTIIKGMLHFIISSDIQKSKAFELKKCLDNLTK
ncbi:TetR/AcrR family transcriptional regulator [Oceanobacillus kimchii]|uniref:TetR/AcrR family transcriptional regulator n=1 Tax=Oceanobacillus kimchii TaxID=746691 RepID=UPI00158E5645|nr:TetR/AcrR family transcriptional regulator [Oceanobacillus kimchii]